MEKSSEFIEFVETTAKVLVAETEKDADGRSLLILSSEDTENDQMNGLSVVSGSMSGVIGSLFKFFDSNPSVSEVFFTLYNQQKK
jgi:hypothetical protein